jgi:heme/copper-type cytochrome/quinol oxidase subunit 2
MMLAETETFTIDTGLIITVLVIIVLALSAWFLWRHRNR